MVTKKTLAERFWEKIDRNGPIHPRLGTRCWVWTAYVCQGYGQFSENGYPLRAHRVAYELHYGVPPQHFALHHCDNSLCCNPLHIYDGTQADNVRDRETRGRGAKRSGMNSSARVRKLADVDVLEIRRQYAAGGVTQRALAEAFDVAQQTVDGIIHRRRWAHLEDSKTVKESAK